MQALEYKIQQQGIVKDAHVLKVDSFLNHQLDVLFIDQMGAEFKRLFKDHPINKILTIEASGIGIAAIAGLHFRCPVVFAKKSASRNLDADIYSTNVHSFTHDRDYQVMVSKRYLNSDDHVLIIDDFMANGCAVEGLIDLVQKAGATLEGIGIVVEKGFQDGGKRLRENGYHVESLAIVESMDPVSGKITFREQ